MLEKIRAAIASQLLAMGVSDLADLRETMLIRQGLFCGRKFECGGFHVVWFIEENEIKFFSRSGHLMMATTPQGCLHMAGSDGQATEIRRAA